MPAHPSPSSGRGLGRAYEQGRTGSKAGIQPHHAHRLRAQLSALDVAACPEEMGLPAWRLHPLTGELSGFWAVTVNANWRVMFRFDGADAELVDYLDYH
ncbi:type II toxin-antitoxin system RelE/ParE family toxin [Thiocystis violacea]|uniref:type II toxin-antitoxin system RelE/ParE family toxin n=1 Tax=Thiocystis violacea TaxID=13725 RepID=UPI0019031E12|nr:Killer protein [Thiocystis violacea]